jgi:LmbE family N-acetylglucosaminyl deacetylase
MISVFKNVLVLAPHTDDGELGAGATISRLIEQGATVTYVAFSTAAESVPEGFADDILKVEVGNATNALGIKKENLIIHNYQVRKLNYSRQEILEDLINLRKNNTFDLVLTPSLNDIHQDHATISTESVRAFKGITILGYELIWNNLSFDTSCFVTVEERHVAAKILSLKSYESQKGRAYMSSEFIKSLSHVRGVQIGAENAECFEVIRLVLR